jgi:hypothetical protein
MECKEFAENIEAYLSDELLVETNTQVLQHLEDCRHCREDIAARRELRQRMRSSVKSSEEFQIDPIFANRLTADLKEAALSESTRRQFVLVPKILIPFFVGVLILAGIGIGLLNPSLEHARNLLSHEPIIDGVTEVLAAAVGHHRSCAVEKLKIWEQSQPGPDKETEYAEAVIIPLQENFSREVELLHTDDCLFEGTPFVHIILKDGTTVISVFYAKPGFNPGDTANAASSILTEKQSGFQIAAFRRNMETVLVVSDLSETENLTIARTLLNARKQA